MWEATRPDRRVVTIDGMRITVVRRDANHYDATFFGVMVVRNAVELKEKQIRAIELVSGCKVIESEYMADTVILNTRVKCNAPNHAMQPTALESLRCPESKANRHTQLTGAEG